MQRILIALLTLTTAVGAWFAFQYHDQLSAKNAQIAALNAECDAARAAEKAALAAADLSRENIDRLTRERDRLQAQLNAPRPQEGGGPVPPGSGGPERPQTLGGMAAMMKTPEGQKMLQNRSATMVRSRYSELSKRLKLSPQDSTVFLGLLADRQTALATSRLSSGGNASESAAERSSIESAFNEKLQGVLGESGYGEFSEYEKSVDERGVVSQIEDQFNTAGTPLDATQKESLVQLMASERQNSPANPFDPSKNDPTSVLNALRDDATFGAWEKQQQAYQDRVLQAATKTLSPDQVNTLKQTLTQKAEREKAGLQMFKTTGVPPPPPPAR
jgi:hypothetical protein